MNGLYALVIVLLIIVAIFGISSGMQSYATAQQAQAQIEVAKVAQTNATANLVVIVCVALVIGMMLALVALLVWAVIKRKAAANAQDHRVTGYSPRTVSPVQTPQIGIEQLIQLKTLELLSRMSGPPQIEQDSTDIVPVDDPLYWLK